MSLLSKSKLYNIQYNDKLKGKENKMTLQQLKDMSEKERVMYLATAKLKELKQLLEGTIRITAMKKEEILAYIIDLICKDNEYEVISGTGEKKKCITSIKSLEEIEVLTEQEILETAYVKEALKSFTSMFTGENKIIPKVEIMEETIKDKKQEMEIGLNQISCVYESIETVSKINDALTKAGSNIQMKYELFYNTERKKIEINMALVSERLFKEVSVYGDYIYIPLLAYSSLGEIYDENQRFLDMDCIYILNCDDWERYTPINLYEQHAEYYIDSSQSISEIKSQLFYSVNNLQKRWESAEQYMINDSEGYIDYWLDISYFMEGVIRESDKTIFSISYDQIRELELKFRHGIQILDAASNRTEKLVCNYDSCA